MDTCVSLRKMIKLCGSMELLTMCAQAYLCLLDKICCWRLNNSFECKIDFKYCITLQNHHSLF